MSNYDRYQNYTEKEYNNKNLSNFFMKKQADKVLLPYIKNIRKKKILEVGPGYGNYTKYLLDNGNMVEGVDINPELGANIGIKITKGCADQLSDKFHDKFECVFSFWMTEYLNEAQMKAFMEQGIGLLDLHGVFATTVVVNRGLGRLYIALARLKGIKKYCYSQKQISQMISEEKKVRMIPLNTILNIPFAVLIEVRLA